VNSQNATDDLLIRSLTGAAAIFILAGYALLFAESPEGYVLSEQIVQVEKIVPVSINTDRTGMRVVPDVSDVFEWPYLLWYDERVLDKTNAVLLVETVNTGWASDLYMFTEEQAIFQWRLGLNKWSSIFDRAVFLVPVFIRPLADKLFYTHALDRECLTTQTGKLARLDLQVLAMIDDARDVLRQNEGITVDDDVIFYGFSASGQFANRFATLHPERVKMVIAGGLCGLPMLPIASFQDQLLRYPIGIADIEELTGKPFNVDAYHALPQFLYQGGQDVNDAIQYPDAFEEQDRKLIFNLLAKHPSERWRVCQTIFTNLNTQTEFHMDTNAAHQTSPEMGARIKAFIIEHLDN